MYLTPVEFLAMFMFAVGVIVLIIYILPDWFI